MKIYFVRHGESVSNALGLRQGPDGGLTAKGIKQAKAVAKKFSKIPLDLIVSSPYDRAKLTAQIISKAIGKKIVYSPLFIERRNPAHLFGKPIEDPEGSLSISVAANQVIDHQKQRYESQHHFRNVIINVPKTKRHPFHHFNFRMAAFGKPIGCFVFKII